MTLLKRTSGIITEKSVSTAQINLLLSIAILLSLKIVSQSKRCSLLSPPPNRLSSSFESYSAIWKSPFTMLRWQLIGSQKSQTGTAYETV